MPSPLPVRQPIIVKDRRKSTAGKPRGKVIESASKNLLDPSLHFSSITELVAYSDITVGVLSPIKCVATACNEDGTLAMLARRNNESLIQLLARLDQAGSILGKCFRACNHRLSGLPLTQSSHHEVREELAQRFRAHPRLLAHMEKGFPACRDYDRRGEQPILS